MEYDIVNNGLVLSGTCIPEEMVVNFLTFVDWWDLLSCRLVCHCWKRVIDSLVSTEKLKRFSKRNLYSSFTLPISKLKLNSLPFFLCFAIGHNVFGKNFLKNPFGSGDIPHVCRTSPNFGSVRHRQSLRRRQNLEMICSDNNCPRFKSWNITEIGGNNWTVETVPVGSQPLPEHLEGQSCFVTSYEWNTKEQLITLVKCGLSNKIMDAVQPHIHISEWYAKRFDCGIKYKLNVFLLNSDQEVVDEFHESITEHNYEGDDGWHQVSHTFKDYGPGVRYVRFEHSGKDTQWWRGHFGSKMAGGSVIAQIPGSVFERSSDSSEVCFTQIQRSPIPLEKKGSLQCTQF